MQSWVVTPTAAYKVVQSDKWDLDLLAGARYLYLKTELLINALGVPSQISDSGGAWDGIVGAKGKMHLNENWFLPFYFDVGAGETELTWQALGGLGYKFSTFDLVVGYRYLEWEFADDDKGGKIFNDFNLSDHCGKAAPWRGNER